MGGMGGMGNLQEMMAGMGKGDAGAYGGDEDSDDEGALGREWAGEGRTRGWGGGKREENEEGG